VTSRSVRSLQFVLLGVALVVGISLIAYPWWRVGRHLHGGIDLEPAAHEYAATDPVACVAGSRPVPAGLRDRRRRRTASATW